MTTRAQILATTRTWIGTPYRNQASAKGAGADCLGLLRGVFRETYELETDPVKVPPYKPDWYERTQRDMLLQAAQEHLIERPVDGPWMPGMVLLFRMKPGVGIKHCAIYCGGDKMIHAYDRQKVDECNMGHFWTSRVVAVFDFPGLED